MVIRHAACILALAAIVTVYPGCGSGDEKVVTVSLSLPADWESVLDMNALGAVSSTPYIGTIRFLYGSDQDLSIDFPYDSGSASFDAGQADELTVQALTAGQVIMEGTAQNLRSGSGDVTVTLEKVNGFSEAGSLLYPRQNHSAVLVSGTVYIIGGNLNTGIIETLSGSSGSFTSSAYAASLTYPRGEAAVLHDAAGNRLFVFKGAAAVDDNLYEIVNLDEMVVVPRILSSFRSDFSPVLSNQEIILVGGYDSVIKDNWQIGSYLVDISQTPFDEFLLPFVGLNSERQDTFCDVNDTYMFCIGGFFSPEYINDFNVFDLTNKSFIGDTLLNVGRISDAVVNLDSQSVVIIGGIGQSGYLADIITVDLESQYFTVFENILNFPRANHTVTQINSDEILIIGGGPNVDSAHSAELLDLSTGESTLLPWRMKVPRIGHTATLLPDGRVLVAGGNATDRTVEVFKPRSPQ